MAREIYSRNWDRMSFEEQREYRDRKLSYFVRTQLYPYSPFYRKLFDENKVRPEQIRRVEDLRRLPFTSKADIAPTSDEPTRFQDFILRPDEERMRLYMPRLQYAKLRSDRFLKGERYSQSALAKRYSPVHIQFTTGRTGLPTPILYAGGDVERMAEAGRRILRLAGFPTGSGQERDAVVNAMPFAPHLGFWMVSKGLDCAGVLALHTGGGRVLGTQRIITSVESMKATGIVGIPSYIYHLLRTGADQGRDFSSVKVVLVSGERIPGGMKGRMKEFLEAMGAREPVILGALGFTEARKGYSECSPSSDTGYHLYPDMDYIELVDPESGEPVDEGEDGELVYTCLEGQGTCVIRFRTGDLVKGGITYETCPSCGRNTPRLGSDVVRSVQVKGFSLTKIKGTLVDQGAFFSVLSGHPKVAEWQVEIRKSGDDPFGMDELNVYVSLAEGAGEKGLKEELENHLQLATEVRPNTVVFLPPEEMLERLRTESEMKELRVVDRRPGA